MIDIAHVGNMGIVKTKVLAREKVWFPKISRLVEESEILPCLSSNDAKKWERFITNVVISCLDKIFA